jgi:hypothetical protein
MNLAPSARPQFGRQLLEAFFDNSRNLGGGSLDSPVSL